MLKATEDQVLAMFEKVHGKLSSQCSAEVVYDEDDNDVVGVACMKDGNECWRATLSEILFDLAVMREVGNERNS